MFNKIVVGVDGSDPSMSALVAACDLAKKYSANLHLVHSPEVESTGIAVGCIEVSELYGLERPCFASSCRVTALG